MSYNISIPVATDILAISQRQIVANFTAMNDVFQRNHVAFTASEDLGKHTVLNLQPVADPTTNADQIALYNKLVTSVPQLFFRGKSDATPIQLTNSNLNTLQTGSPGGTQSTFLAGPFTVYMGFVVASISGHVITLTGSTNVVYAGISTYLVEQDAGDSTTAAISNITGNQFTFTFSTIKIKKPPTIYYMAVGI